MARKYSSIWKQLKDKKHCAIAAPIPLHARIIKAVTSEKYRDMAYKLQMQEKRKHTKIYHRTDGARIQFFLREYDVLTGISFSELTEINELLKGESNECENLQSI